VEEHNDCTTTYPAHTLLSRVTLAFAACECPGGCLKIELVAATLVARGLCAALSA
jgi:hypothetical protein